MARKLCTLRVIEPDYERYRLWCSLTGRQQAEALGVLLDSCDVPSLEKFGEFLKRFEEKDFTDFDPAGSVPEKYRHTGSP